MAKVLLKLRKTDLKLNFQFSEEVEVSNPVMNLFVKAYLKKQQGTYVADLKKALGE